MNILEYCDERKFSNLAVDTPILVSNDCKNWYKRYFAYYNDGYIYVFFRGGTSWSTDRNTEHPWLYGKMPPNELEEYDDSNPL